MWRALFHCDNAYRLPAVDAVGRVCRTHKTSQTAFRGFGGPQGMLVIEEILARAAAELSLPAHVVRERNFYRDGDTTHYGQPVEQAGRISDIWTRLKDTSRFDDRREAVAAFNARSTHVKRGLAMTPVKFGISFTAAFFNQAGALVLIYRDGSVQVNHGGTEMGQGLFTKIQQIAADSLGVTLDRVRLMPTRTDKVPNTSATAASAGTDLNGAAVLDACAQLRERLRPVAAGLLACEASEVRFEDDAASRRRPPRAVCRRVRGGLHAAHAALRPGLLPHARHPLRRGDGHRQAVPLLRLRRRGVGSGGGRLHRRPPPAQNRYPAGRGRFDFTGGRPRPDRRRLHPGHGMADDRGAAVGRPGTRGDGRRLHLQAAVVVGAAGGVRGEHARSAPRSPTSSSAARRWASRR